MLEAIIRVLAPHYCFGCNAEDTLLCDACRNAELRLVPSRCYGCKKLTRDYAVCKSCRRHGPLKHVWPGCEYTALPRQLIHVYKFERAKAGYEPIARQMSEVVPLIDAVVVPVPTATTRVRQRGYDHTALIAKRFAQARSLPYQNVLMRLGQQRQVGAERSVRLEQAASFFMIKPKLPMPERVLLIDDVLTTGATLQAAARCLKQAGVKEVNAATFAHKQ